jgi:hypothetical protein
MPQRRAHHNRPVRISQHNAPIASADKQQAVAEQFFVDDRPRACVTATVAIPLSLTEAGQGEVSPSDQHLSRLDNVRLHVWNEHYRFVGIQLMPIWR